MPSAPANPSTRAAVAALFTDEYVAEQSFSLWDAHLHWLHEAGFKDALRHEEAPTPLPVRPQHELVELLERYVLSTGYVNAHIGLTSSDITDNVRLLQIVHSLVAIDNGLVRVIDHLRQCFDCDATTVGFTHWQPAAPLTWRHRVRAWTAPLAWLSARRPAIHAKKLGGPVGDAASLVLLLGQAKYDDNPFMWEDFDLDFPANPYPLQSSDHTCEVQAIDWVCLVAAQLHKIALDLRFLSAHQLVRQGKTRAFAGSSSMPHKVNPFKWEKVCSICRSISTTQAEMWAVAAHNSLERTLDTSWQLKQLLHRAFDGLAYAIDELCAVEASVNLEVNDALLAKHRDAISSDRDLTRRVIAGESRWAAYVAALSVSHKTTSVNQ